MAKKTFTTESLTTLVDEIKAYVLNAVSKKADSSHSHSISNITNLQKTLDEKDTAIEEAKIEASNQDAVVLLEAQRYIDAVADSKADATHGHEITDVNGLQTALDNKANNELATDTENGIMSSTDKKNLDSVVGTYNLGNFNGKTIADLLTAIDSWLDANSNIANASAYFIADKSWITGWNSGNTSAAITGGDTWTITNVAPYPSKTYTQLRISYYVNKEVYYVHRYNGTWGNVYQAAFKDDVDKKQDKITGGATTITGSNLTASRALVSNGSGKVAVSDVTSTELGYLDGVTSNIQTQLNSKSDSSHTHSSYVNQNAFSNIAVSGQTTVAADTTTDTVTFAGSNMSITTNATTDTVTFSVANASTSAKGVVQLVDSATNTATDKAATANAVNTAYTLASKANTTANSAKTTAESKSTVEASSTNGKIKIDGTDTTVYTHPTDAGNKHIPSGGSSGQVLKWSSSGSATWGTDKDTTYSLNSGDSNGTIKVTPSSGSTYNVAVKGLGSVAYTNTVPVANGGTGATSAAGARTNLDVYSKTEVNSEIGVEIAKVITKERYLKNGSDLNAVTESGFYRMQDGHINSPSNIGAPCNYSQLIVAHGGGDTIAQIIIDYSNSYMYIRSGNPSDVGGAGSWTAWSRVLTANDIRVENGKLVLGWL